MVITIDGLSGNGKTALAKLIAKSLGYQHVSTGYFFRCLTYRILSKNLDLNTRKDEAIKDLENMRITFNEDQVFIDDIDVTNDINSNEVSVKSSEFALNPDVNRIVTDIERRYLFKNNVVIDGRDVGTRVAPEADYKFYIYARNEIRIKRLMEEHPEMSEDEVRAMLEKRDMFDLKGNFTRPVGGIEIDTSDNTLEELATKMLSYIDPNKPETVYYAEVQ